MKYQVSSELEKLHSCQLLLANEVKRICQKHNIKYFMIAGTLLGAVRHKGFIPWDDDMDFAIMRSEYGRFLEACKTDLGEDFLLQEMFSDKFYGLPMAKLLLKGTTLVERSASKNKAFKGIYIDVFPYDNIPNDIKLQKKHNKKLYFLKRIFLAKQHYSIAEKGQLVKSLVYGILKVASLLCSRKFLRTRLENELCKYSDVDTKKVAAIGGAYSYFKESVEKSWFEQTVELPFENTTFSAPKDYIAYLEYFYGDYMTPPPPEKRENRHGVVELDFGKYNS